MNAKIENATQLSQELAAWMQGNEGSASYPLVDLDGGIARVVGTVDAGEPGDWTTAGLNGLEVRTGEHEVDFALSL